MAGKCHVCGYAVLPIRMRFGSAEEIAEDMRRGRYLSAEEARTYGLIDALTSSGC